MTTGTVGNNHNVFAAQLQRGLDAAQRNLVKAAVNSVTALTKLATAQLEELAKSTGTGATATAAPVAAAPTQPGNAWGGQARSLADVFNMAVNGVPTAPTPVDASHPSGSMKVDNNGVITTPGGYKIEQLKQFDWLITGPDGKSTKIWGDPHVAESDGGKWDFKRDSTFVLGDGTRINVTTKPWGNGMTVTGGLEVIAGNDRVLVTDIDKGKGKVGQVTQDGYAHVNSFGGKDVFVMGKESDDWSFQGKEIVGSHNGGESFKLGNDLAPGAPTPKPATPAPTTPAQPNTRLEQLLSVFKGLSKVLDSLKNLTDRLTQRANQNGGIVPPGREPVANRRKGALERAFAAIGRMLDTVARFQNLSRSIDVNRNRFLA